ncbi:MAG TPA: serine protease [Elusimicrobia bacterium]|nr:serine protease [Elusimicrobiota bacterium]
MKTIRIILGIAAFLVVLPMLSPAGGGKAIYGEDDRLDYFAASPAAQTLSGSVVSFWRAGAVENQGNGKVKLKTVGFGARFNLCPNERFREQPSGSFCSGALVGETLVLTAGHCITGENACRNARIVFGYAVEKVGGEAMTVMPAGEIYSCARILQRSVPAGLQTQSPDFALIQLDRKVRGHKPLPVSRGGDLRKGDAVFMIGHPKGLPLKVAGAARVRDFYGMDYFETDLDTSHGNSGSPVFNSVTGKIEGVMVAGGKDFIKSPAGCTMTAVYGQAAGSGEFVTSISAFSSLLPALTGENAVPQTVDMDLSRTQDETVGIPQKIPFIDGYLNKER